MAHTSLYRKYRPETFDDVVGQSHIERTLRNAVAEGTVAHAYLFTGPRGTGKTTTARLLAKALLCEKGPTGEPDATCEQCIEIAEGRHPDVHELDAASRTGVDNVREEIIGRVQFAPTRGRYKVYIIDEVHMLSTQAFNALLKTLEEPPPHVVFVLATTHPHKVPETIHSRCQRFDFHRIGVDDIVFRLRKISDAEGFEVSDAALTLIARHASGGMRDAITTLEQLASFGSGKIGLEDVEGLIGEVDSAMLFELTGLIARRDIAGCFRWIAHFVETGIDLAEFVRALTSHVRDLYVVAAVGDGTGIVDRTAEEMGQLEHQAASFGGPDRLARVLDLLGELGAEMRWSSDPRMSFEVALTRMARPQGEMTLEALAERVEALERGTVPSGGVRAQASAQAEPVAAPRPAKKPAARPSAAEIPVAPAKTERVAKTEKAGDAAPVAHQTADTEAVSDPALHGTKIDRASAKRNWQAVLMEIRKIKPARVQTFSNVEIDVDDDGETLRIEFEQAFAKQLAEDNENRELLKRALGAAFGFVPAFRFQLGRGAATPPDEQPAPATVDETTVERSAADEPVPASGPEHSEDGGTDDASAKAEKQPVTTGNDLEDLLVNGLGARIVAEHPAAMDGEDEQ